MIDQKKALSNTEVNLKKLDDTEHSCKIEFEEAYWKFTELRDSAKDLDPDELLAARLELRQDYDSRAVSTIQQGFRQQL